MIPLLRPHQNGAIVNVRIDARFQMLNSAIAVAINKDDLLVAL